VKDINNLLDYSVWSGSDYSIPAPYLNQLIMNPSKDFSSIGESCMMFKQNMDTNWGYFQFVVDKKDILPETVYNVSFDCYCPDEYFNIGIRHVNALSSLRIPSSEIIQHVTLTAETPSEITDNLVLRWYNNSRDSRIYLDNINLVPSS